MRYLAPLQSRLLLRSSLNVFEKHGVFSSRGREWSPALNAHTHIHTHWLDTISIWASSEPTSLSKVHRHYHILISTKSNGQRCLAFVCKRTAIFRTKHQSALRPEGWLGLVCGNRARPTKEKRKNKLASAIANMPGEARFVNPFHRPQCLAAAAPAGKAKLTHPGKAILAGKEVLLSAPVAASRMNVYIFAGCIQCLQIWSKCAGWSCRFFCFFVKPAVLHG